MKQLKKTREDTALPTSYSWRSNFIPTILNYIKLTRPSNNFITALSVLVGAAISGEIESWAMVLFACLSAFFISAGGNVINDFFDIDIDRINKPNRPLPRAKIPQNSALIWSILLFLPGLILSLQVRTLSLLIAFIVCVFLVLYSYSLKKTFLWGNLTVSVISALAFVYGGIATEDFRLSLIPAAFALLFHLGREILKDMEDIKGDSSAGASTLPIKLGVKFSLNICTLIFLFLIGLTIVPYLLQVFSLLYLLVAVLGVDLGLIYLIWSMRLNHSPSNLHRLSNLLKIEMLVGLAAIFSGKF
jgi:geranylgeranylglycerol-phosphate geranylgeranyltransferase